MARLTDTNMTPAERRVFANLQRSVGYSPKVLYGRDLATNDAILQRILEKGPTVLYAIAVNGSGQMAKKGVREFRLLVAPVPVPAKLANGTREAVKKPRYTKGPMSAAHKAHIKAGMKKHFAKL